MRFAKRKQIDSPWIRGTYPLAFSFPPQSHHKHPSPKKRYISRKVCTLLWKLMWFGWFRCFNLLIWEIRIFSPNSSWNSMTFQLVTPVPSAAAHLLSPTKFDWYLCVSQRSGHLCAISMMCNMWCNGCRFCVTQCWETNKKWLKFDFERKTLLFDFSLFLVLPVLHNVCLPLPLMSVLAFKGRQTFSIRQAPTLRPPCSNFNFL